jgi:hypothetical protein
MKLIIQFLVLVIPTVVLSQSLSGTVKDSITNEKLPLANITFMKGYGGTNSNLNGDYSLNLKGHLYDSIKVSFVGYKSRYIQLNHFTENKNYTVNITLLPQENELDEVIIPQDKAIYTKKNVLSEKKVGNVNSFYLIGQEVAYLVKNEQQELGKIKSVKIYFRNNKNATFTAKYRIKIYSYNKAKNIPDENLLKEDIIISPKNKTYQYVLDLKDKQIPFLEEGVCIGVELIDENNTSKNGDKIGPGLRLTYGEEEQTWNNYRNRGWYLPHFYDRTRTKVANLMVEMTVLMKE